MMMKKITAVIASLVMLTGLAACGQSSSDVLTGDNTSKPSSSETTKKSSEPKKAMNCLPYNTLAKAGLWAHGYNPDYCFLKESGKLYAVDSQGVKSEPEMYVQVDWANDPKLVDNPNLTEMGDGTYLQSSTPGKTVFQHVKITFHGFGPNDLNGATLENILDLTNGNFLDENNERIDVSKMTFANDEPQTLLVASNSSVNAICYLHSCVYTSHNIE